MSTIPYIRPFTEHSNGATRDLDTLGTSYLVATLQRQDFMIARAVETCIPAIVQVVDGVVEKLLHGGRLFYIGSGTSGRLGVLDAAECPPTFGVDPSLVQAIIAGGREAVFVSSEGQEDYPENGAQSVENACINSGDAVIGIHASGHTPYVLGALKKAISLGAFVAQITNSPVQSIADEIVVIATVGPESLAGSTRMKAGSAQKMILNLISTSVMVRLGRVYDNLMVDLRPTNAKLVRRAVEIIVAVTGVSANEAMHALTAANNSCKTAILMLKRYCPVEEAEALLAQHNGFLRRAMRAP